MNRENTVAIFDIDGTIAYHGKKVNDDMKEFLQLVRQKVSVALVGGSNLHQMYGKLGANILDQHDFVFAENGLVAHENGKLIAEKRIIDAVGSERVNELVSWALSYISKLTLPVKRGTFVDFRTGLINFSPAGRHLGSERHLWVNYDNEHGVRREMVRQMSERFPDWGLEWVIGGQMGFDVFPKGWNKSTCLQYLDKFETVHFFGDRVSPEGNDYPLYVHPRVTGHAITTETNGPDMTRELATKLFL